MIVLLCKKEIISKIFLDYYFRDIIPECKIKNIEYDFQAWNIINNINKCNSSNDIESFIERYGNISNNRVINANLDLLEVYKTVLHEPNHWYPNLERLKIIGADYPDVKIANLIGLDITTIYIITACIIVRTLAYSTSLIKDIVFTKDDILKVFGTEHPQIWFTKEQIHVLCNENISFEQLDVYFNLFSKNILSINEKIDKKDCYLYHCDNEYAVIYLELFVNFVVKSTKELLLIKIKQLGQGEIEKYKHQRGKSLEEYTYSLLNLNFNEIYLNKNYIDIEAKKRELDLFSVSDEIILNIECKSSDFDLYDYESNSLIKVKLNAFKNTLNSINALNLYAEQKDFIELYSKKVGNDKKFINLKNKSLVHIQVTLNPIDIVGTNLQKFYEEQYKNYKIIPINLNIMDFMCLMVLMVHHRDLVIKYFKQRFAMINNHRNFEMDISELNVFGFITDNKNSEFIKMINTLRIDSRISINNSAYKNGIDKLMAIVGLPYFVDEFIVKDLQPIFLKIFET